MSVVTMTSPVHRWLTAADAPDSVPAELSDLGAHLHHCSGSRGRWFGVRCAADAVQSFVAGHFVTTLLIAGAAIGALMAALL